MCRRHSTPKGVDVASAPQAHRYGDGTIATPPLALVGTWDGNVFELSQPPQLAKAASTWIPPAQTGLPTQQALGAQSQLNADTAKLRDRGIWILADGFYGAGLLYVRVALADATIVAYIKATYGAAMVVGWLQPM